MRYFFVLFAIFNMLLISCSSITSSKASTSSKIIFNCYEDGDLFLDGKIKAKCLKNSKVSILTSPGKHFLKFENKNINNSKILILQKKVYLGDMVSITIDEKPIEAFNEEFYIQKTKESKSLKYLKEYLKIYPQGKYSKKVRNILKNSWELIIDKDTKGLGMWIDEDSDENLYAVGNFKKDKVSFSKIIKLSKNGKVIYEKKLNDKHIYIIRVLTDNSFVIAGEFVNKNNRSFLEKFDADGNLIWSYILNDSQIYGINKMKNGNILAFGYKLINGSSKGLIINLDKSGNEIFRKYYLDKIVVMDVRDYINGFIAVGETTTAKPVGFILMLDKEGKMQWNKKLNEGLRSCIYAVMKLDKDILFAGNKNPVKFSEKEAWIFKLDENLNKKWEMLLTENRSYDYIYKLYRLKNGKFLALGGIEEDVKKENIFAVVFSKDGKLEKEINIKGKFKGVISEVKYTKSGNIISIGFVKNKKEKNNFHIIKFDKRFLEFVGIKN